MKIFATLIKGQRRSGVIDGDQVSLLNPDADVFRALTDPDYRCEQTDASSNAFSLDQAALLPPIVPTTVRDFITFEQHAAGAFRAVGRDGDIPAEWFEIPTFYFTNPYAIVGPYDDVPMPPNCQRLDFELEVAVIIGRDGFNLSPEEAGSHIAGFAIFNDWSARDVQTHEMKIGLGPAKGKDTCSTLGPMLVTPDELAQWKKDGFYELAMNVAVNDEPIGRDTLSNMAWTFDELISYASRGTWVRAGDVVGSGTCGGGCLAELWGWSGTRLPPPLEIGDIVTMTVEGLGTIRNRIVEGVKAHPLPAARRRRVERPVNR